MCGEVLQHCVWRVTAEQPVVKVTGLFHVGAWSLWLSMIEQPVAKVPGLFYPGACRVWLSTVEWPVVKVPGLFYPGTGSIWLFVFEQWVAKVPGYFMQMHPLCGCQWFRMLPMNSFHQTEEYLYGLFLVVCRTIRNKLLMCGAISTHSLPI
jgi:hypothetical protein